MPALDLSDSSTFITRREDATMQCPKTMRNDSLDHVDGVSQNFDVSYKNYNTTI